MLFNKEKFILNEKTYSQKVIDEIKRDSNQAYLELRLLRT